MHLFLGKPKAVNEVLLALVPARFDSTSHFIIINTKLMIIKVIIRVLESNHNNTFFHKVVKTIMAVGKIRKYTAVKYCIIIIKLYI